MKQLTVITLISLLSLSVKAMDHDIDAQTWCKNVVMGWNLGNALESAGGDWDYDNYAWTNVWEKDYAKWETAWGNPKTTKEMIHALKEHGFNAIRVPVRWVPYADIETMEIDESWIARVKEVVDWCMAEDMQVILNTHHELWLESYPIYTMKETLNGKLGKLWTNIATAFADYDGRLAFAGTNEVTVNWAAPTAENYDVQNSYNQTFIDAVRATGGNNAKRNLIVQTYATDPTYGLAGFVIPNDPTGNRLSVEFHYYSPYSYCSGGKDSYFYWGKAFADKGKITPDGNEDTIANLFLKLRKEWWDKGLGIVMGEYGCSHHSQTMTSRHRRPTNSIIWRPWCPKPAKTVSPPSSGIITLPAMAVRNSAFSIAKTICRWMLHSSSMASRKAPRPSLSPMLNIMKAIPTLELAAR